MSRIIRIEHLARIEGHGAVTVELHGKEVGAVHFQVFEGIRLLEGLIRGRPWTDIPQITSRICAICSAAHALTAVKAIENAFGVVPTPGTMKLRDLLFRGENIESHALHLFLLAAPDYFGVPDVAAMASGHREAVEVGLRLRRIGNRIQEVVGGRPIHPVNAVPGGFGYPPDRDELIQLHRDLEGAQEDVRSALDFVASLPPADFVLAPTGFVGLDTPGGHEYFQGDRILVQNNGKPSSIPVRDYRDLLGERTVSYSHSKQSRIEGNPVMVGALARLVTRSGHLPQSAMDAADRLGLALPSDNPLDNNKAQAVELVCDVEDALRTVSSLLAGEEFPHRPEAIVPFAGTGVAATEAPRGTLFYSIEFDESGCVVSADVVTPTAINAASIEERMRAVAEAHGSEDEAALRRKLEMVVRAYDPCISCSVH